MSKTDSRERCVLLLFEADQKEKPVKSVVDELAAKPDQYCITILDAYQEQEEKVQELINQNLKNWSSDRIPNFDRAVLRMAITELIRSDDTPAGTVISEAVKLCENYSTDESPRFVNGVLSTVAHKVRTVEMLEKVKASKEKDQD